MDKRYRVYITETVIYDVTADNDDEAAYLVAERSEGDFIGYTDEETFVKVEEIEEKSYVA